MSLAPEVVLGGAAQGCLYGLTALSLVFLYRATGVLSFMQGEAMAAGAYVAVGLAAMGAPLALAAVGAIAAGQVFGTLAARFALEPVRTRAPWVATLTTFGLALALRGVLLSLPAATQGWYRFDWVGEGRWLGLAARQWAVMLAAAGVAAAFALLLRGTTWGRRVRASAEDAVTAERLGIDVARLRRQAWGVGTALAVAAGLAAAPITFVHPDLGSLALNAFPAAVLGGMKPGPTVLAAGVGLGVLEAIAAWQLPPGGKELLLQLVLIAALLALPRERAAAP
ncbi:branched-chain amino acid ABC transporter permease [Tepidiphilus olei]|uniref:branched-chain amino acid ABC transporter permease n=1 Tax=Tepidiphilus olei TaxID=2502184 RepID=UPI00115E32BF|nr:branched-chain amino acid ABC transporter permease [Tepidiphilus olei]